MASVVQSAGGLERQSTTSWLAGSVGSRWTSANPSTIEAVQARKWQRLRTQSTKRHSFWNAKTGSGRGEVTSPQIVRDESLSSNGRPAGAPTPERGTVWAHWSISASMTSMLKGTRAECAQDRTNGAPDRMEWRLDRRADNPLRYEVQILSCLSWNWRERSSVKITERAHAERAKALDWGREGCHPKAALAG